jgi:hypothetical protein
MMMMGQARRGPIVNADRASPISLGLLRGRGPSLTVTARSGESGADASLSEVNVQPSRDTTGLTPLVPIFARSRWPGPRARTKQTARKCTGKKIHGTGSRRAGSQSSTSYDFASAGSPGSRQASPAVGSTQSGTGSAMTTHSGAGQQPPPPPPPPQRQQHQQQQQQQAASGSSSAKPQTTLAEVQRIVRELEAKPPGSAALSLLFPAFKSGNVRLFSPETCKEAVDKTDLFVEAFRELGLANQIGTPKLVSKFRASLRDRRVIGKHKAAKFFQSLSSPGVAEVFDIASVGKASTKAASTKSAASASTSSVSTTAVVSKNAAPASIWTEALHGKFVDA